MTDSIHPLRLWWSMIICWWSMKNSTGITWLGHTTHNRQLCDLLARPPLERPNQIQSQSVSQVRTPTVRANRQGGRRTCCLTNIFVDVFVFVHSFIICMYTCVPFNVIQSTRIVRKICQRYVDAQLFAKCVSTVVQIHTSNLLIGFNTLGFVWFESYKLWLLVVLLTVRIRRAAINLHFYSFSMHFGSQSPAFTFTLIVGMRQYTTWSDINIFALSTFRSHCAIRCRTYFSFSKPLYQYCMHDTW